MSVCVLSEDGFQDFLTSQACCAVAMVSFSHFLIVESDFHFLFAELQSKMQVCACFQ